MVDRQAKKVGIAFGGMLWEVFYDPEPEVIDNEKRCKRLNSDVRISMIRRLEILLDGHGRLILSFTTTSRTTIKMGFFTASAPAQLHPVNPPLGVFPNYYAQQPTTLVLKEKAFSFSGVRYVCLFGMK